MHRRIIPVLLIVVLSLGSCAAQRGYDAHPVSGPTEHQRLQIGDMTDNQRASNECFEIEYWSAGFWSTDDEELPGVYCKVDQ